MQYRSIIVFALTLTLFNAAVFAHGVGSKPLENGKVEFRYDDGTPFARGYISVCDGAGKEIATGQADDNGVFDYSAYSNAASVVISDVHGHRLVFQTTSDSAIPGNTPFTTVAVVLMLLGVASLLYFMNKKENKSRSTG